MAKLIFIALVFITFKTEAQSSVLSVADSLYAVGNYSKSIQVYKQHQPEEITFEKIAQAYNALGNYDQAIFYYDRALKSDLTNALLKYNYAKLLTKTKKHQKASYLLNELLETDNSNPNYHYELGLVLEQTKDTLKKAHEQFLNTYKLDQTHQKAIFKIAKYYLVKRKHDTVNKYIEEGLKSYANNKQLISLKAQNYYWQENYKNAIIWFEKLLELGESSQFLHEKLSLNYLKMYNYNKAIEHAKLALKFEPKNVSNLYILGQLYTKVEDFLNAEKYIQEALELEDVSLYKKYMSLAMVLNRQKKYKQALKALKKAVKENPTEVFPHFVILTTKTAYYENIDEKIKLHEDFLVKYPNSQFQSMVEYSLSKLKEDKFMKKD